MFTYLFLNIPIQSESLGQLLGHDIQLVKQLESILYQISLLGEDKRNSVLALLQNNSSGLLRVHSFDRPLWPLPGSPTVVPGSYLTPPDNDGTIGGNSAPEITVTYGSALQSSHYPSTSGAPVPDWNDDWNSLVDLTPDGRVTAQISNGQHTIPLAGDNVTERVFQQANEDDPSLRAALQTSNARYHDGLTMMRKHYEPPGGGTFDMKQISLAVQAGYAALRPDIFNYIRMDISSWLLFGLWPPAVDPPPAVDLQSDQFCQECSNEVKRLDIITQSEASTMQRRVVRIRLYHWYVELQNVLKASDKRPALRPREKISTKAIELILEKSHPDWESASDLKKKLYRAKFHRNKEIGLKWCTLVKYLGEGIAVICGKEMDSIINDTKFNLTSVHMLATFVRNFHPEVPEICGLFGFPLKCFIQDIKLGHQEHQTWQGRVDQAINMVNSGLEGPQVPLELSSNWSDQECLDTDLTGFVRCALA